MNLVCVKGVWLTVLQTGAVCPPVVGRLYAMDTHIHMHPMALSICPHFILEELCWKSKRESLSAWSLQRPCLYLQQKAKLITNTSNSFVMRVST